MDMVEGKEFVIENGILKVYKGTGAGLLDAFPFLRRDF